MIEKIQEAAAYLQQQYSDKPNIGIILGSGLGTFGKQIEVEKEIDYSQIPHFPISTVKGHQGKLIFGKLEGKQVVAMSGRFHTYEGYAADEVIFPIRVMKLLGVQYVLISNAAGAMNSSFNIGDIMFI
jgi:purine-nucleoside phosphorylase